MKILYITSIVLTILIAILFLVLAILADKESEKGSKDFIETKHLMLIMFAFAVFVLVTLFLGILYG